MSLQGLKNPGDLRSWRSETTSPWMSSMMIFAIVSRGPTFINSVSGLLQAICGFSFGILEATQHVNVCGHGAPKSMTHHSSVSSRQVIPSIFIFQRVPRGFPWIILSDLLNLGVLYPSQFGRTLRIPQHFFHPIFHQLTMSSPSPRQREEDLRGTTAGDAMGGFASGRRGLAQRCWGGILNDPKPDVLGVSICFYKWGYPHVDCL